MISRGDGAARELLWRSRRSLVEAPGWRRAAAAVLAGAISAAALPPVHQVYVLIPALAVWVWLLDGAARYRGAFALGWSFGFGYFAAGCYWVYHAFLVQAGQYEALAPFAVVGLAALLALLTGAAAAAAHAGPRRGVARLIVLAAAWTVAEWVRSWFLTGFPWNLLGTVWAFSDAMIQPAAWVGTYGLGFLTFLALGLPAVAFDSGTTLRRTIAVAACGLGILAVMGGIGTVRLAGVTVETVPNVRLRLVQPNIPQKIKWDRALRAGHVEKQVTMSRSETGGPAPNLVIWAETAVPYVVNANGSKELLSYVARAVPQGGLAIVGAPRAESGDRKLTNALLVLDDSARVIGYYDKSHLVPFGEYVPLRGLLKVSKLVQGRSDFSPGVGPAALKIGELPPFSPLICYEIIFPDAVVAPGDRPQWLLNLTNDAWFGLSPGPYQHLASARMRAVEQGLPLVRVANTGISGVADAYGRLRGAIPLGQEGILDAVLPRALPEPTAYGRIGNWAVIILLMIALSPIVMIRFRTILH